MNLLDLVLVSELEPKVRYARNLLAAKAANDLILTERRIRRESNTEISSGNVADLCRLIFARLFFTVYILHCLFAIV